MLSTLKLADTPDFIFKMYEEEVNQKNQFFENRLWDIYLQDRHFMLLSGSELVSFEDYKEKAYSSVREDKRSKEEIVNEALLAEQEALSMLDNFI